MSFLRQEIDVLLKRPNQNLPQLVVYDIKTRFTKQYIFSEMLKFCIVMCTSM